MKLHPTLLGGLGLGALGMFLLDPHLGRRRRALLRDKAMHYGKLGVREAGKRGRDLRNRLRGRALDLKERLRGAPVDDRVLVERIRSRVGHELSAPADVEVTCCEGACTLTGAVAAGEHERLLTAVAQLPGVAEVVDRLTVREQPVH